MVVQVLYAYVACGITFIVCLGTLHVPLSNKGPEVIIGLDGSINSVSSSYRR